MYRAGCWPWEPVLLAPPFGHSRGWVPRMQASRSAHCVALFRALSGAPSRPPARLFPHGWPRRLAEKRRVADYFFDLSEADRREALEYVRAKTGCCFRSNWHRLMSTATKPGRRGDSPVLNEPFTFHDLRAKSGSDADDVREANDRLAHDDLRTTQVIYRRKPRRVRLGRKVGK